MRHSFFSGLFSCFLSPDRFPELFEMTKGQRSNLCPMLHEIWLMLPSSILLVEIMNTGSR